MARKIDGNWYEMTEILSKYSPQSYIKYKLRSYRKHHLVRAIKRIDGNISVFVHPIDLCRSREWDEFWDNIKGLKR